jgi:hypothetical protein
MLYFIFQIWLPTPGTRPLLLQSPAPPIRSQARTEAQGFSTRLLVTGS